MSNEIQVIYNQEVLDKDFKVYGTADEPLFLAKDVAEWIEYSKTSQGYYNVSKMLMTVDEDEKVTITISNSDGKPHQQWFLTEDGVYEVLMQSRKPVAKAFKKKVKEILKEIRKTGSYSSNSMSPAEMLLHSAQLLVDHEKQLKEHEARLLGMEEKNTEIASSIEEIKDVIEEKVYPYPDKKKRDKLRNSVYAFAREYLDVFQAKGEAATINDVISIVNGYLVRDFLNDGINLSKELEQAKQFYMEKYSRLHLARAMSPDVLRPAKIRDLSIQSLISTSAEWMLKATGLLTGYKMAAEKTRREIA